MTEISSEGTPIDALESGNVPNSADAARMAQIMQDINASGGDIGGVPQNELMPQERQALPQARQAPPQMLPPHSGIPMAGMTGQMPAMVQAPPQNSQFVPYDEPVGGHPRKNVWGTFMERLTDPLVVAVLIFVLSLPALQTLGSKYAPWAFAIGGQLSWLGLITKAVFGGLLFWLFKTASAFL